MTIRLRASKRLLGRAEGYSLPQPDYPKDLDTLASKGKSKFALGYKLTLLETDTMPYYKAVDLAESELGPYTVQDSDFDQIRKFRFDDGTILLPVAPDGAKYLLMRRSQ